MYTDVTDGLQNDVDEETANYEQTLPDTRIIFRHMQHRMIIMLSFMSPSWHL